MANYANQKLVVMPDNLAELKGPKKGEAFLIISQAVLEAQFRKLNKVALALFFYFMSWAGAKTFMFSKADFMNRYGVSQRKTVDLGIQELKKFGYIEEDSNKYFFHLPE